MTESKKRIGRIARWIAAPAVAAAMIAGPASAAQQTGLVNVNVEEVTVAANVPIAIAANVCDVNVLVLVAEAQETGSADCDATADAVAENNLIQRFLL